MKNGIIAIVIVVIAGASFWGGGYYQRQQFAANRPNVFGQGDGQGGPGGVGHQGPGGRRGPGGFFGGRGGGGSRPEGQRGAPIISGRIDRVEDDELTLTTRFGSVKVAIDDQTKIRKVEPSDQQDLEQSNEVLIEGRFDDEGNMTAEVVIEK